MFLLLAISSLSIQKIHAEKGNKSTEYVIFDGVWRENSRSLSPIPFTAFLNNSQLTIECTAPDYDIGITIVDANGKSVWQRNVSAPETSFISISLNDWLQGSYTIIISNDYGGYLQGTFQL